MSRHDEHDGDITQRIGVINMGIIITHRKYKNMLHVQRDNQQTRNLSIP